MTISSILDAPTPYQKRTVYDLLEEAVSLWSDEYCEDPDYMEYAKAKNTAEQLLDALKNISDIADKEQAKCL
jgi:hypothetical protein